MNEHSVPFSIKDYAMKTFGSWLAIACVAFALGCNKSDTPAPDAAVKPGASAKPSAPPDPAAAKLAAVADKPDVYVQTLMDEIASGNVRAVWTALPEKQQADVISLKNEFATKMDADIWNKVFVVLDKATQVLKAKKEMILNSPMFGIVKLAGGDAVDKNWDTVVGLIDTIAKSEIKTIEGLKSADPAVFLATTGNTLVGGGLKVAETIPQAAAGISQFKKVKVTLVKVEGDTATLNTKVEGEPEGKEGVFKKVDGKWLPASEVAEWDQQIKAAKAGLADLQIPAPMKTEFMNSLGVIEKRLDSLLAASNQEAFDTALGELVQDVQALNAPMAVTEPKAPGFGSGPLPTGTAPAGTAPKSSATGASPFPSPSISPPSSGAGSPGASAPSSGPSLTVPSPSADAPKSP